MLVSNVGQSSSGHAGLGFDLAQAFTTGNAATLHSVDVEFNALSSSATASQVSVTVNADAGGSPGAVVGTLAWPAFTPFINSAQTLRLSAPVGGISLAAGSTYFVVFDVSGILFNLHGVQTTASDGEDAGAASGWSIADTGLYRDRASDGSWTSWPASRKIGINGVETPYLVSAPSVVFVREGQTVSVRLDLAQEVTASVAVSAASSDSSRFLVSHPRFLHMPGGRRVQSQFEAWGSGVGTRGVDYGMRQLAPSGSIDFGFDAQDWAGYGPDSVRGFRVVEISALRSGAGGQPGTSPDAVFDLVLSSTDSSVVLPSVKVVVQRGQGALDPRFDPDPLGDAECRLVECLSVVEGGSTSYTVRNFVVPQPGSPLTVTPTALGGGLSFSPSSVSWSSVDDFGEERTITVTAAHDADAKDRTVVIRHVFSDNWDTNGALSEALLDTSRAFHYSKAQQDSQFDMAVRVADDDKLGFATFANAGAHDDRLDGAATAQVKVDSSAGMGRGSFDVRLNQPLDCSSKTRPRYGPELQEGVGPIATPCYETLYVRLQSRTDGGWVNSHGIEVNVTRTLPISGRNVTRTYCEWLPIINSLPSRRDSALAAIQGNVRGQNADPRALECHKVVSFHNAPMTASVTRWAPGGASFEEVSPSGRFHAIRVTPDTWDHTFRVNVDLDASVIGGSDGHYDVSMSLTRPGEPSAKRKLRVSYGANPDTLPDYAPSADDVGSWAEADDNSGDFWVPDNAQAHGDGTPQTDNQQQQPADNPQQTDNQQQPADPQQPADSQPEPAPFAADPQVVAAVQYLASQTHHGFAHVNRWQRALAAIGALDPAGIDGGALTLAEAKQNTRRYSSPVWAQIVTEIEAKAAHDTAQQQQQQQQQPVQQPEEPPPVVPTVTVTADGDVTEGDPATFTVTADAAPAADLAVIVEVAASGDYGVTAGARTVMIPAGTTSKTLSVPTVGDTTDEPDGSVTATVTAGDGYTVGAAAATVAVADDDDPPPPVPEVVPDTDPADPPPPYAADPQVVAAVRYLASQTHHGFAHVNRWQRALAAIGALDPAGIAGGALTLAEAKQNTRKYSSPVWAQVVTEIEAKAAHDTTTD